MPGGVPASGKPAVLLQSDSSLGFELVLSRCRGGGGDAHPTTRSKPKVVSSPVNKVSRNRRWKVDDRGPYPHAPSREILRTSYTTFAICHAGTIHITCLLCSVPRAFILRSPPSVTRAECVSPQSRLVSGCVRSSFSDVVSHFHDRARSKLYPFSSCREIRSARRLASFRFRR